jgi:hypothetical protein
MGCRRWRNQPQTNGRGKNARDPPCLTLATQYLKAKEELWKFKYFTMQKYNLQKNSSKKKPKSFNIL